MSEIQCNSVTSSKKRNKNKRFPLEAIKKIITETEMNKNCGDVSDKVAIIQLVKRNLQRMCLTKNSSLPTPPVESKLIIKEEENSRFNMEQAMVFPDFFMKTSSVLNENSFDRSKNIKEVLRKAILDRQRCAEYALCKKINEQYHLEKIWRPW